MKILHIAPFNVAGVPIAFVKAERKLGHESRLITMGQNPRGYEEDICLDLPFLYFPGLTLLKRILGGRKRINVTNKAPDHSEIPPQWKPNIFERFFIALREKLWLPRITRVLKEIEINKFDVIQLDGAVSFFRDGRDVARWKEQGKKIICCYTGSDLRVRGVIPQIDAMSDLNVSVEFDHLKLHPNIHHVFFPFDAEKFAIAEPPKNSKIRIGHAPTNRAAKGSDVIISVLKKMAAKYPLEIVLIENLPYQQALKLKSTCHIFIDQIGDLGYGINGLEALAMGIPTCSCLAEGFAEKYPDQPFVEINGENMEEKVAELVINADFRRKMGLQGRKWVIEHHDPVRVVEEIQGLLAEKSIGYL